MYLSIFVKLNTVMRMFGTVYLIQSNLSKSDLISLMNIDHTHTHTHTHTDVHRLAPSKVPALRLEQLTQAGDLGIPITTGILLGKSLVHQYIYLLFSFTF